MVSSRLRLTFLCGHRRHCQGGGEGNEEARHQDHRELCVQGGCASGGEGLCECRVLSGEICIQSESSQRELCVQGAVRWVGRALCLWRAVWRVSI